MQINTSMCSVFTRSALSMFSCSMSLDACTDEALFNAMPSVEQALLQNIVLISNDVIALNRKKRLK